MIFLVFLVQVSEYFVFHDACAWSQLETTGLIYRSITIITIVSHRTHTHTRALLSPVAVARDYFDLIVIFVEQSAPAGDYDVELIYRRTLLTDLCPLVQRTQFKHGLQKPVFGLFVDF